MTTWIADAIAHAVMAGRNFEAARRMPDAARGLRKMAAAHLRRAVSAAMRDGELNHALAATYLDDGVDQLGAGESPAGPCERRGCMSVAREGWRA